MGASLCLWITARPPVAGYTTGMDELTPEDRELRAWLADLLNDTGSEGAFIIAEALGIDPDEL